MDLPALLQARLQDARSWVEQHYRVSIWHRQAIYDALGPPAHRPPIDLAALSPSDRQRVEQEQQGRAGMLPVQFPKVFGADRTLGHIRRTYLSILTVEYILPIWEQHWYPLGNRTSATVPKLLEAVRQFYVGEQIPLR